MWETFRTGHSRKRYPPAQRHEACKLAYRQLDKGPGDRQLEDELRDVDNAAQPGELVAFEFGVLDEAEDGGIGERSFVEGVEKVYGEHEGEEGEVDSAQDSVVGGGGDRDAVGGIVTELDEHHGCGIAGSGSTRCSSASNRVERLPRGGAMVAGSIVIVVVVVDVGLVEGTVDGREEATVGCGGPGEEAGEFEGGHGAGVLLPLQQRQHSRLDAAGGCRWRWKRRSQPCRPFTSIRGS